MNHLPECPMKPIAEAPVNFHQVFPDCICPELRACEQRVLSVAGPHNYSRGRKDGYAAALSAARDAVAASGGHSDRCICDECYGTAAALAAIDALRGSGNPDTPPSAEKGEKP